MSDTIKNLGRNLRVGLYVAGAKLGKGWKAITKFQVTDTFYEGDDEYLGRDDVEPWQVWKKATGSFTIEEENAGDIDSLLETIRESGKAGQKVPISIGLFTENNDGTTSRVSYSKVVLKPGRNVGAKGDKITRDFSFEAGSMKVGS